MDNTLRNETNHFLYLNREGKWSGFAWSGLELRRDGSLALIRLPALTRDLPPEFETMDAPEGPAGIAVTADGTVYYTNPMRHLLYKIDPCPVQETESPSTGESGSSPCPGDRRGLS